LGSTAVVRSRRRSPFSLVFAPTSRRRGVAVARHHLPVRFRGLLTGRRFGRELRERAHALSRRGILRQRPDGYGQQGTSDCDSKTDRCEPPLFGRQRRLRLAFVGQTVRGTGPKESDHDIETNGVHREGPGSSSMAFIVHDSPLRVGIFASYYRGRLAAGLWWRRALVGGRAPPS